MLPEIVGVPDGRPPYGEIWDQQDDEILLVLCRPDGERPTWVRELMAAAYPSLTKSHHYSKYHCGFLGQRGTKPFVIVEWTAPGRSALERRWVLARLPRLLTNHFSCKKIAVYLEPGSGAEQLAMVEDLVFKNTTPRFESCKWTWVKILTPERERLLETDPLRESRFKRQLLYRRWINENPDTMTSIRIGEELEAFAKKHGCRFESLDEVRLKAEGLRLLLAVGGASKLSPPRLHLLLHQPAGATGAPLLLVGKGITFDTGGINLKPHESFVNCMKNDMGGAALMSQIFMGLVESGYPKPLALAIPACENLIAENSVKPGTIIKSHKGLDVIIEHTDAEGRLILADALSFAQQRFKPSQTILAATLTTSALRQYSAFYTPVYFADQAFEKALLDAGNRWGEAFTFWGEFLPFLQGNRTPAADLTNMGRMPASANIGAASNVAAHFLKEFSSGPLIHLDIFATVWNWGADYPSAHYGATGAPFNTLFAALRSL